jgi:molybdenum cofactor synthesis domain-containing protein
MLEVRDRPIEVAEVLAAVAHPGAGAVDLFVGRVRDNNAGEPVTLLEYETYDSMARQEFVRIGEEVARAFPSARVAALHRVGALRVGEIALLGAASAPHRDEAFRACRHLIEAVKARLPVWKREHGPGGPHWVGWTDARCGHDHDDQRAAPQTSETGGAHERRAAPPVAEASPLDVVTLTISDSRTSQDDTSGSLLCDLLGQAGFHLVKHVIVPDDPERVRAQIVEAIDGGIAQAVISTGGTGLGPRDQTYEAVRALLDRTLDGFGEAFRRLSWDDVGPRAILSRAIAGTYHGGVVMALPGSPGAVRLGVEQLVIPTLRHASAVALGRKHAHV